MRRPERRDVEDRVTYFRMKNMVPPSTKGESGL
jgi:hypothetical protein